MLSTAGPRRTTRPRRSRAATSNGRMVSSAETAAGARLGIAISGAGIMACYLYARAEIASLDFGTRPGQPRSLEHDLVRPAYARRSIDPHVRPVPGLRAGGKPASTFRDHARRPARHQ